MGKDLSLGFAMAQHVLTKRSRRAPKLVSRAARPRALEIPRGAPETRIEVGGGTVHLTNLEKIFWPELGLTKRDLLQYYLDVSPWLLRHLKDRAMVMKRYPNGIHGPFFFMKRAPERRPDFIRICSIEHASGNVIGFPVVEDQASLLWVVNLGCIDLNPWYARCDDVYRPDYLHFDLDPTPDSPFERVLETALVVREALDALKIKSYAKNDGIARGSCVRSDRARAEAEGGVEICEGIFTGSGAKESEDDHGGISRRQATRGASAGGLQPKCLEPHAGFGLFGEAEGCRDGIHAGELGRD